MGKLHFFLAIILMTLTYNSGQLFVAIKSKVSHTHYFLGFGPAILNFQLGDVKITLGIYLPLFPFARMYKMADGKKERANLPWEFHNYSIGRRVLATMGGTFALIVSGIIILILTTYFDVEEYISKEEVNKLGIYPSELAQQAGFRKGDRIVLLNGKKYQRFNDLIYPDLGTTYTILREGKTVELTIQQETVDQLSDPNNGLFFYLQSAFEVGDVFPNTPAEASGLMKGDRIISVNDVPVYKNFEMKKELLKSNNGEAVVKIERVNSGRKDTIDKKVSIMAEGTLGISIEEHIKYSQKENSFPEAILKGLQRSWYTVYSNIVALINMFSGELARGSGSYTTIGKVSQGGINWQRIGGVTGSLFLNFALMTLLPVPRAIFWEFIPLSYESILKRPFSLKLYKGITKFSFILFVGLMVFSLINDLMRHLW